MDLGLSGKWALITGASKGIGRATAIALAEEGCNLILVSRDGTALSSLAEEIQLQCKVTVRTHAVDLSHQAQIERLTAELGELDILVNNAGAIPQGDLFAVGNDAWRAAWDLKVFGYISLCRALYENLKKRGGVIVNIIGSAGERMDPDYITGSTGNAGLMAFTRALGKAAPRDGMRVVGINPGPVATSRFERRMRDRARKQFGDESRWQEPLGQMPFARAAKPEEIASAVAFLASPRSGYTTGTVLTIDGGQL